MVARSQFLSLYQRNKTGPCFIDGLEVQIIFMKHVSYDHILCELLSLGVMGHTVAPLVYIHTSNYAI